MTAPEATDTLTRLQTAAAATVARGTASFTFVRQDHPSDATGRLAPQYGPLKGLRAARSRRWLRMLDGKTRRLVSEGIIDLPGGRCAIAHPKHARIIVGPVQYTGAPGTRLRELRGQTGDQSPGRMGR
ncbi:MAG TPA: hypothetical protein VG165_01455 [Solirubrobacteraceae bacterium]|nr:hypothetical protein [Solirubrobacteraceae bacterium]